ncbi:MAG: UDP-N-acetylmuramoyl-L-alanine--D-glutamate ligase [Bacteroidetes bacterium]|nr:UDP-N-acetylmuramoyl-L-alanine--D-glutamate ligase [Bacteroidota bacterium]
MTKRIAILGGGESGVGTAVLAKERGLEVFVSDSGVIADKYKGLLEEWSIPYEEGKHSEDRILNADEVMKSPGIPEKAPIVKKIRSMKIPIISELEFAYRYTNAKIVGITGSNGKTTTTALTYALLKNAGLNVGMAGNVGLSFAYMVATDPKDVYVLEISSFQLDDIKEFKCDVAVLLNITPDHLDRYEYEMSNYVKSKFKIVNKHSQDDVFIYCADDEETMNYMKQNAKQIPSVLMPISVFNKLEQGGWADEEKVHVHYKDTEEFDMLIQDIGIKGKHNLYNSMAAGIVGKTFGLRKENIRQTFEVFKSLEHRLENVLKLNGIEYINDSKATNVNSTWYALESIQKPVVLILGGVDKGNDYSILSELVKKKVKAIVCLGKDNNKLHEAFQDKVDVMVNVESMKDAVNMSTRLAAKGDVVLLSPACASFDLFQNYEDRGKQFKQCVKDV